MFRLAAVALICLLGLVEFIGELAITETRELQAALAGSVLRLFICGVASLFVIASVTREFNDKGFELILSLDIPRHAYYSGKLLGFFLFSTVFSIAGCMLLLIYSDVSSVLLWGLSLEYELLIVITFSLLCLVTFSNVTVSFMVFAMFYMLARSVTAIQLVSTSPILESNAVSQRFLDAVIDIIAFLLPRLDLFTQSSWLVYGADWGQLTAITAQGLIYAALLVAAALFDLYRKEL